MKIRILTLLILAAVFHSALRAQRPTSNYHYESATTLDTDEREMADKCVSIMKQWNQGLNNHATTQVSQVYCPVTFFYTDCIEQSDIVASLKSIFKKYPQYYQYITDVKVHVVNSCHVEVNFNKNVITSPGAEVKTYAAYLHFDYSYDGKAQIKKESDEVTDKNVEKRQRTILDITNQTPLDKVFCPQNIGKYIDTDYWKLVGFDGDDEGPLAKAMIQATGLARSTIKGTIRNNYHGQKGLYYCGGHCSGSEAGWYVIYLYDSNTGILRLAGSK